MNMYDDYFRYVREYQDLIDKINECNSSVLFCLHDVLKVTDYIYQLYIDKEEIPHDLEEIFEVGFGYLNNVLQDLDAYYTDYFNKNMDIFNYYSELIIYSIYLDDYICYLDGEGLVGEEIITSLNDILEHIDEVLLKKYPCTSQDVEKLEADVYKLAPYESNFKPVYLVFSMIMEELDL